MALKHLILCLGIAATCAVEIDISEKTPENNPDLNRKNLGTLQDAWEAIEDAAKEYYYAVYATLAHNEYTSLKCKRLRTYCLNHTAKSAYYTLSWYGANWRTRPGVVTRTGDVRALAQEGYELENVMRYWYHGACFPYTGTRTPNGTYNLLDYKNDICYNKIRDPWWRNKINHSDSYVVFRQRACYITRQLNAQGTCEFWLSESSLNATLDTIEQEEPSQEKGLTNSTGGANSTQTTTKKSTSIIFHKLPNSCRVALLFSCGYPTVLTYYKEVCDKINKTEIPGN